MKFLQPNPSLEKGDAFKFNSLFKPQKSTIF